MSIIGWIVIGALGGGFASLVTGMNQRMGWLTIIIVGIAGAVVGSALWAVISGGNFVVGFDLVTLLFSVVGAMIVLFVGDLIARDV